MQVFEHHQHRFVPADPRHEIACRLEQRAPVEGLAIGLEPNRPAEHAASGLQSGQRRVGRGRLGEHLGQLGPDPGHHLGEGQVGQSALGQVEAVPDERPPTALTRRVDQSVEQARLADPGITTEQHGDG